MLGGFLDPTSAPQGSLCGAIGPTVAPSGMGWIKAEDPFNTKTVCSPQYGERGRAFWEGLGAAQGASRSSRLMAIPVLRGVVQTRWSCGDSKKAATCSS